MIYIAYTIHVAICLFLILVVLLQQGKGADLSVFGGGTTQSAFGARGAATLLHKMTVAGFVAFIFTTITIGFLQGGGSGSSVMSTVEEGQPAVPVETDTGEAIPAPVTDIPAADDDAVEETAGDDGEATDPPDPSGTER